MKTYTATDVNKIELVLYEHIGHLSPFLYYIETGPILTRLFMWKKNENWGLLLIFLRKKNMKKRFHTRGYNIEGIGKECFK